MELSFWDVHGFFFIFFMFFFPRLTMLLATSVASVFGGPLFWIGLIFLPRLTVAIIATTLYFNTNPILCVFTWMWALGGETTEKKAIVHKASD